MEEHRRGLNLIVFGTFLLAVIVGVIYYFTGDPGEEVLAQGTLIANLIGKELPYVPFWK